VKKTKAQKVDGIEQRIGTEGRLPKTRRVVVRGAHDRLWLYTIAAAGDEPAGVVGERVVTEEEAVRLCGSEEEQGRRTIRANALHTASWRMAHWPEKYPTMGAALAYGRERDGRQYCCGYDDRLYAEVYGALIAEAP
jgi:hypothetical protein